LGLHSSADVAHSTFAAKALWSQALSLQTQSSERATPTGDADANGGDENVLLSMAEDILKVVLNKEFEFDMTRVKHLCADRQGETFGPTTPTTVVLYQELERHNALKDKLERTLRELIKALTGEIGMSPDLEAMTDALSRGRLPDAWKSAAPPTEKDLQSWMTWYKKREKQFKDWVETVEPKVIWLSGLHCPETYIAALIQRACRKMGWPLDASAAYTEVTDFVDADEIQSHPEIGCYISGLFLEGAVWDRVHRCLAQPSDDDKSSSTELPILRLSPALRSAS
jgi:dynein heavy chain